LAAVGLAFSLWHDPMRMKPSRMGIDYLLPIFTDAIGEDDMEHMRQTLFAHGNLTQPYHSINTDVNKRIRYFEAPRSAPAKHEAEEVLAK
jgi:hypothetical protein